MEISDNRIRILRVITRMNIGGPANQVLSLSEKLSLEAFQQRLLYGVCTNEEKQVQGIDLLRISSRRIDSLSRILSPWRDFLTLLIIVKEIRQFKPHVIHTHTSKAGFLGRIASIIALHKCKLIHTFHGHLLYGYFPRVIARMIVFVEKMLARITHVLIAVGDSVAHELITAGIGKSSKFCIIYPGVKTPRSQHMTTNQVHSKSSEDRLLCAFVGRVTQIKRPDRFLEVVQLATKDDLPIDFVVIGDGELLQDCKTKAEEFGLNVRFLGWREDIYAVLETVDIVMLTSDNEGTPFSLIQAAMLQKPVIATNVGSVSEVVIDRQTGLLVSPNSQQLYEALTEFVQNKDLREKLGKEAKLWTCQRFSESEFLSKYSNLYTEILRT